LFIAFIKAHLEMPGQVCVWLFSARGYQEQYVVIIPSKKLEIVRFGATSVRAAWDMNDFLSRVTAAVTRK
jgi:hypothetical protein